MAHCPSSDSSQCLLARSRASRFLRGILCVWALAVGELNAVAPIPTMLFIVCYTCVNASCPFLVLVNDPNCWPTFKYHHWTTSVVGAVLCVWMRFAISPMFALGAIVLCSLIFVYAPQNSHSVKWGDGFQGMKFQLARNVLMKMDLTQHMKNWRPHLLVVTGASMSEDSSLTIDDPEVLSFASQLKGGRGITTVGGVCSSQSSDVFSDGESFKGSHIRHNICVHTLALLVLCILCTCRAFRHLEVFLSRCLFCQVFMCTRVCLPQGPLSLCLRSFL